MMTGHCCHKCHRYWTSSTGKVTNYVAITRWCPVCIPLVFPAYRQDNP